MKRDAANLESEWLEIGTIVAASGLKGEVRVYPNSDFPERFETPGQRWLLRPGETQPQAIELLRGQYLPDKKLYLIELAGIQDRNQAEALRGCRLMVLRSDRPALGEDEYHVLDLIGLEVFNQLTGEAFGTVVDVIPAGNDILEVQPFDTLRLRSGQAAQGTLHSQTIPVIPAPLADNIDSQKGRKPRLRSPKPTTVLIPFVKAIVPVVDLQAGRIEMTPPPGLLDLA